MKLKGKKKEKGGGSFLNVQRDFSKKKINV